MLFRKAEESEARILTVVGLLVTSCVTAVAAWLIWDPFGGRPADVMDVAIESPYVGEGVEPGTELMMHGVKVGEVTAVTSLPGGGVRLDTRLQQEPTAGLTDAMNIDFRPANYFGVTGINLRAGEGGSPLTSGSLIEAAPDGNFTLQALLSRLGEISHGVITPKLINVVDRTTTYIDGLDPLLETMLVVAGSLADVQNVRTERLMANATGISVAFPGFVDAAITTGNQYLGEELKGVSEGYFRNIYDPSIELSSNDLFGAMGKLVSVNSEELASLTNMIKILTDIVPGVVPPDQIAGSAVELRTRLERLFSGPPDRRAVNVRVILDSLPGVAAPIHAVGAAPAGQPGSDPGESPVDASAPAPSGAEAAPPLPVPHMTGDEPR